MPFVTEGKSIVGLGQALLLIDIGNNITKVTYTGILGGGVARYLIVVEEEKIGYSVGDLRPFGSSNLQTNMEGAADTPPASPAPIELQRYD